MQGLASLTSLTDLDMCNCDQVSDDGLQVLVGLSALTSLNLEHCPRVTNEGVDALAGRLTALTNLLIGIEEDDDGDSIPDQDVVPDQGT
jgi:hypothetical protein